MAIDLNLVVQVLRTPESRDVTESPIVRAVILSEAANAAALVSALERAQTREATMPGASSAVRGETCRYLGD